MTTNHGASTHEPGDTPGDTRSDADANRAADTASMPHNPASPDDETGDAPGGVVGAADALALFALLDEIGGVASLGAALAPARAQGGQPLADAAVQGATDDLQDALMDRLMDAPTGAADQGRERGDDDDAEPAGSHAALTTSATASAQRVARLSPGTRRALTLIFGAFGERDDEGTMDEGAYTQRATPPIARVAEAREAYRADEASAPSDADAEEDG